MQPTLPPLPVPKDVLLFDEAVTVRGFTKQQMHEYALEAVAAEREACAKACDNIAANHSLHDSNVSAGAAEDCAELIRARGSA